MDIVTILICVGTGLLVFGAIGAVLAILFGFCWCIEKALSWAWRKTGWRVSTNDLKPMPQWLLPVAMGVCVLVFVIAIGCRAAFALGWIADCPWCEVKP